MAVRSTQLGPHSSGGSVRRSVAPCHCKGWVVRLWYGGDPKSTAIAAARWLRAVPGHQGRSLVLASRPVLLGRGNGPGRPSLARPWRWTAPASKAPCKAGPRPDPAGGPGLPKCFRPVGTRCWHFAGDVEHHGPGRARHSWCIVARMRKLPLATVTLCAGASAACLFARCLHRLRELR